MKQPDGENRQTHDERQADDDPTRRPQAPFGYNLQLGSLELMHGLSCRQISRHRFQPFSGGVCIDNRDVRNEAIATFWKSLDESRILSRVPQCTPKLRDCDIDSLVEITKTFVGPNSDAQFLPGDDFPRTLQQYLQQFHRLLLDSDSQTGFAHFARVERNLVGSESHDGGGPQGFHGAFGRNTEV